MIRIGQALRGLQRGSLAQSIRAKFIGLHGLDRTRALLCQARLRLLVQFLSGHLNAVTCVNYVPRSCFCFKAGNTALVPSSRSFKILPHIKRLCTIILTQSLMGTQTSNDQKTTIRFRLRTLCFLQLVPRLS